WPPNLQETLVMPLPRPALPTATVIAFLFGATTTRADPAATDTTQPATAADSAPIAPPAPDAPPEKVEEAKKVAETAALTPIVPNPNDATHPAFLLYAEIDPPLLATGAVFALARRYKTQAASCAPACDSVRLDALDKLTAGYYSATWSTASDYLLYGLGAASA